MTAPRPAAAAVPCTALEHATPTEAQRPRQLPAASVFLVTTAKSGPGTSTSTIAKARNAPYAGQIIGPIYAPLWPAGALTKVSQMRKGRERCDRQSAEHSGRGRPARESTRSVQSTGSYASRTLKRTPDRIVTNAGETNRGVRWARGGKMGG